MKILKNIKINNSNFKNIVILFFVLLFFIFSLINNNINYLNFSTVILLFSNIYSCSDQFKKNISFLLFNISFFVFIVSRYIVSLISPDADSLEIRPDFDDFTIISTSKFIFLSLLFVRIGYSLFKNRFTTIRKNRKLFESVYVRKLRSIAQRMVFVTLIPYSVLMAEKIYFVAVSGYESYYIYFSSGMPLIISRIALLYEPILFLYLATLPNRRSAYLHILIYVTVSALSLGFGQRNGFVLAVVFSVIYLSIRDQLTPNIRLWLPKRWIYIGIFSSPIIVSLMAAFSYFRSDTEIVSKSIFSLFSLFFISQGSAVFNISHAIENLDNFPDDKFYSFGPIISFFKENIFVKYIFNYADYALASPELATQTNNFSFALAYVVDPDYYARGGGYGSNYIAELWVDFGLFGIIFGSILYGILLAMSTKWLHQRGPFFLAFTFSGVLAIVYAPRAEFLGFVAPILSMPTIVAYYALHLMARKAERRAVGLPSYRSPSDAGLKGVDRRKIPHNDLACESGSESQIGGKK